MKASEPAVLCFFFGASLARKTERPGGCALKEHVSAQPPFIIPSAVIPMVAAA